MEYIAHRRYRGKSISGPVNVPACTALTCKDGLLLFNGEALCLVTSEVAHRFFSRNDDGQGLYRGRLVTAIQRQLAKQDAHHQARWDKIWDDPRCQPFKRKDYEDHWLWGQSFYDADIDALRHIARLVGAKEEC